MTLVGLLRKWLVGTPLTGKRALACAIAAVGLPTIIRGALHGTVEGLGFSAYFPFVLLAAILLEWKLATIVSLASAILTDALFVGPRYQLLEGPADVFGVVTFLVGSSLIVALVHAIRTAFDDLVGPTGSFGVFFSLEKGQAWASWPKAGFHLRLGPPDDVTEMMKDFIAQVELGKRLNGEVKWNDQDAISE